MGWTDPHVRDIFDECDQMFEAKRSATFLKIGGTVFLSRKVAASPFNADSIACI